MTTATLDFSVVVNQVDFSREGHVRVNIKKRTVEPYFKTLTSDSNVNLSYIESEKASPDVNLVISDRSRSLPENALLGSDNIYVKFSTRVFTTRARRFLVTDRFTTEVATQTATPLFYYHLFKYYNPDLLDWSSRELLSYEFIDVATMKKVNISESLLDSTNGKIYSNIQNSYEAGIKDITFIRYSVKVTSGSTSTVYSYQELVNNKPIFEPAEVADLDDWGNLSAGCDAYLVEELPGNIYYRITLPSASLYAYRELEPSKIYLKSPAVDDLDEPWCIRVTNGEFMSAVRIAVNSYRSSKYYIAEFTGQTFNPYYPYKFIPNEYAAYVNRNLVQVSRNVVDNASAGFPIDILVYDSSAGAVEFAYTSDTTKVGSYISGSSTVAYQELIASVDETNGFIEVSDYINTSRKILVSYYTDSDEFDFTTINFNPLNNADILDKRVSIYINPETSNTGTLSESVHYLEIDKLGRITYCSQAASGGIDPATSKLLTDFYTDGTPRRDFYYDTISTQSGLRYRPSGVFQIYRDYLSFIDKYTVETQIASQVLPSGEYLENLSENPGFLILGDVMVGEARSSQLAGKTDVRVRGGGIKEGYDDTVRLLQPEADFYWDHEIPYPGAMSFFVQVPQSLLQENEGDFTLDQIREIAGVHADFGAYPVVRNYGLDPVIVSGVVTSEVLSGVVVSGLVQLTWTTYGTGALYDIYMSMDRDEGFEVMNPYPISDTNPTNQFVISGLYPETTYYTYLEATKNSETHTGPKYSFETTPYVLT